MRLQHSNVVDPRKALAEAGLGVSTLQQRWRPDCRRTILLSSQNRLVSNAVARGFHQLLSRVSPRWGHAGACACRRDRAFVHTTRVDVFACVFIDLRDGTGASSRIDIDANVPTRSTLTRIAPSTITRSMYGTRIAARACVVSNVLVIAIASSPHIARCTQARSASSMSMNTFNVSMRMRAARRLRVIARKIRARCRIRASFFSTRIALLAQLTRTTSQRSRVMRAHACERHAHNIACCCKPA